MHVRSIYIHPCDDERWVATVNHGESLRDINHSRDHHLAKSPEYAAYRAKKFIATGKWPPPPREKRNVSTGKLGGNWKVGE